MLVTLGSPSDACAGSVPAGRCTERDGFAAILAFRRTAQGTWQATGERAAGLRNPLALARHRSGSVWAADNALDLPAPDAPMEPLVRVEMGRSYGWPYCMEDRQPAPPWADGTDRCSGEAGPAALLPAHAAPVDMAFASSPLLGGERMLMTWHGYAPTGGRLVALPVDGSGMPRVQQGSPSYRRTTPGGVQRVPYPARLAALAPDWTDLITRWDLVAGWRPKGAPTGIATAPDGAVWIVEDKNRTILRLARGEAFRMPEQAATASRGFAPDVRQRFDDLAATVLGPRCGACHQDQLGGDREGVLSRLVASDWLEGAVERLTATDTRRMPPAGDLPQGERDLILRFVRSLP